MRRDSERGSALIWTAGLMLTTLLGMGALAIDMASLYVARNLAQQAADSAALAGAKVFVESGCVTSGDCTAQEASATTRAQQVGGLISMEGQPFTISVPFIDRTSQNPQITVQAQISNLHLYFAGVAGWTTAPIVSATATAEAYNPSGTTAGAPTYCTGCVRPWLIANCDQSLSYMNPASTLCVNQASLLNLSSNYGVSNPSCTPTGVIGAPIDIRLRTAPALYAAVDVDSGIANLSDYQTAITTCFTGQTTCGTKSLSILPNGAATWSATTMAVENLMHIAGAGSGLGQDTIDPTVCPPQIHAGGLNPLVTNGVVNPGDVISTSDSIVTAYIFDGTPLSAISPQSVNIVGFAQIFVTQAGPISGEFRGVVLGVAGCGGMTGGTCNSSAIQGPTMIPVRLITAN